MLLRLFLAHAQVSLGASALVCFLAADLLRKHEQLATIWSMVGWFVFTLQVLDWMRGTMVWRAFTRRLIDLIILAAVSTTVLLIYYARSRMLEGGVDVDAVWTFMGLQYFLEGHNPMTFGGMAISYHQFPLMLLTHLPAFLVGFDRLHAFSVHVGTILFLAVLFAVVTQQFLPGRFAAQAVTVMLVSSVFSNRMLVLLEGNVGYTIPAVCLGLMFLVIVDRASIPNPNRMVGGLLSIALLYHLPGWCFVLPICVAWLLIRKASGVPLRDFFRANPILLMVLAIFAITLVTHPGLILRRVRDVSLGSSIDVQSFLIRKFPSNWCYLVSYFPRDWFRRFFVQHPGSTVLMNLPPFGGLVAPLVVALWVGSAIALPGQAWRYAVALVAFALGLLGLTALQCLVTGFEDYRMLTMAIALIVAGFVIVFRVFKVPGMRRAVAVCVVMAAASYNYLDMATLRGHAFWSGAYHAPRSQETMEHLLAFTQRGEARRLGLSRIYAVVDPLFPLHELYVKALKRSGSELVTLPTVAFCPHRAGALRTIARSSCGALMLVERLGHCDAGEAGQAGQLAEARETVRGYWFPSVCGLGEGDHSDRPWAFVTIGKDGRLEWLDDEGRTSSPNSSR